MSLFSNTPLNTSLLSWTTEKKRKAGSFETEDEAGPAKVPNKSSDNWKRFIVIGPQTDQKLPTKLSPF